MHITRRQYGAAATASGTELSVAAARWAYLEADRENRPHFNVYHIAYYAGAMIAVAAMTILLGNFWHELSGLQISLRASFRRFLQRHRGLFLATRAPCADSRRPVHQLGGQLDPPVCVWRAT